MCDEDQRVRSLASVACVVLGVLVASQHDYYAHLTAVSQVVSALVATALWRLMLFGARLRLNLGQLLGERCDASTAARQVLTTSTGSSRSAESWVLTGR